MLEPIDDIVITVFPEINMILVDFFVIISKQMEFVLYNLGSVRKGLSVSRRNAEENGYKVVYTRIWRGRDIALELKKELENLQNSNLTVYCQVEHDSAKGVTRSPIIVKADS